MISEKNRIASNHNDYKYLFKAQEKINPNKLNESSHPRDLFLLG